MKNIIGQADEKKFGRVSGNCFLELELVLGVPIPNKWPSLESLERLPPRETALPCLRGLIKSKLLFHHLYSQTHTQLQRMTIISWNVIIRAR